MREFSVPASTTVSAEENLTDMVWANADRFAGTVSFRRRVEGTWIDVTAADFAAQVMSVAKGLIAAGLEPGDRIALMSRTRYEWSLLDFAIWAAGAVSVPIYETSSADQVEWLLADSQAKAVIVEDADHRRRVDAVVDLLPEVRHVWQIEGPDGQTGAAGAVDELTALGGAIPNARVRARSRAVGADDLATLIYTSGTTGRAKGCELTHRNLLAEVRADITAYPKLLEPGNSVLMFLPMAHVLARAIAICAVYARTTLGHTSQIASLVSDLGTFRPTFVLTVPRVFEKVHAKARAQAHDSGRGSVFDAAEKTAIAYSRAREASGPSIGLRVRHAMFDRLVYRRLRAALGGRCVAAVSGGAPLSERLTHFFRGVGIPVLEGYGLTETTAAACVNTLDAARIGTVGRPVAGTTVRIADDGEVLIKGEIVTRGYWNDVAATAQAMPDGWFHTGDLGELDSAGFLRITGRKKEIIVTAGGKNVAPAALEDRVREHPLVSHCMLVGDRRPFIGALITLDDEALAGWRARRGLGNASSAARADDPDLLRELQRAVDAANESVSTTESIKRFRVLDEDFTEAGGDLTPSLKLRRNVIVQSRAVDIESIYQT
ncbi:AMP-dependent synthetase/ligase [Actinoalloteichus fjordicus]|uniref:Acyl-CoA synthetase n=1 Tax=Actinoalloteichus fjordicus TaxID=1612552 RepID=A0AAC9PUA0_9PSEU|nr:long-chain fatty acid--CoA ligase [Actinoalloteichus fjordicus]APU16988.1 AMP-forming long-chain acyl-CoA synthetase [Actinoalloteichus fjordicus]